MFWPVSDSSSHTFSSQRYWRLILGLERSAWSCSPAVCSLDGQAGATRCWNFSTAATSLWHLQMIRQTPLKRRLPMGLQLLQRSVPPTTPTNDWCQAPFISDSPFVFNKDSAPKILLLIYNLHACTFDFFFFFSVSKYWGACLNTLLEMKEHFCAAVLNQTHKTEALLLWSCYWHNLCLRDDQSVSIYTCSMLFGLKV